MGRSLRAQRKALGATQAEGVILQTQTTTGRKRKVMSATWIARSSWAPDLDPVSLVDPVRRAILEAHRDAIREGQKADGSGPQPKLMRAGAAGRAAAAGSRRDIRGNLTGDLADNIESTPVKTSTGRAGIILEGEGAGRSGRIGAMGVRLASGARGVKASTTIRAANATRGRDKHGNEGQYQAFVAGESERGHEYFYVEGKVDAIVDKIVNDWFDAAIDGPVTRGSTAAVRAKDT